MSFPRKLSRPHVDPHQMAEMLREGRCLFAAHDGCSDGVAIVPLIQDGDLLIRVCRHHYDAFQRLSQREAIELHNYLHRQYLPHLEVA